MAADNEARIRLTAVDETAQAINGVRKNLDGLTGSAGNLQAAIGALAGSLGVMAFASMIKSTTDAAAALHDLSIATGASVEGLSAMAAIGKMSDTSTDMIAASMNRLAKNMSATTEEGKGAAAALRAIGVNFDEFSKLSPDQKMQKLAVVLDEFQAGSAKSAVAIALLGREGAKMLPFMRDLATAGDLQARVTKEQAARSDNFTDNLTRLQASGAAWKKELVHGMLPALDDAVQAFVDVTNGSGGLRDEIRKLTKDGTINEWTRNAVTGFSYVLDVGSGVIRTFRSIGMTIAASAAQTSTILSAMFNALMQVMNSNFSGALDILKGGIREAGAIGSELGADLSKMWSDKTLGQNVRDAIDKIVARGPQLERIRRDLNFSPDAKESAAAIDKEAEAFDRLLARIGGKESGVDAEYEKNIQLIIAQGNARGMEAAAIDEVIRRYDALQPYREAERKALEEEHKALLAVIEANAAQVDAQQKTAETLRQQVMREQEHTQALGLTKLQLADLEGAKLRDAAAGKERLATIADEIDATGLLGQAYREQAQNLRDLAAAKRATALREDEIEREKQAAEEAKKRQAQELKFWESIDHAAHDVWNNILEGGTNVWRKLKDTAKAVFFDWLYQQAARPIIFSVGASLGLSGAAQAATTIGAGNSMMSGVSLLGGAAGIGGFMNGLSAWGTGGSVAGVLANPGLYSMAELAGVFGPIALGAGLLIASLTSGGETRSGGNYTLSGGLATLRDGPSGGEIQADVVRGYIQSTASGINDMLRAVGSSATLTGFQAGLQTSSNSRGGVFAGGRLSSGAAFGDTGIGDNYAGTLYELSSSQSPNAAQALEAFRADLLQTTVQALQAATDIPDTISRMLQGVDAESLSIDAATALIAQINATVASVQSFDQAISTLPLRDLVNQTFDWKVALLEANGGLQALTSNLNNYYQNFYSKDEQRRIVAENISRTLSEAGMDVGVEVILGATRQQFRDLFEQFAPGSAGWNALLSVNAQFASITDAAEQLASTVEETTTTITEAVEALQTTDDSPISQRLVGEFLDLQIQLMRATGDIAGADALQRGIDTAGMTPTQVGLYDANNTLRAQIAALTGAVVDNTTATTTSTATAEKADKSGAQWTAATGGILEEIARIRAGSVGGNAQTFAQLQAQFATASAAARAGSLDAAGRLPGLSQSLLAAGARSATSLSDLRRLQAGTIASLSTTAAYGAGRSDDPALAELRALRAETAALRTEQDRQAREGADINRRAMRVLEKWDAIGMPATQA